MRHERGTLKPLTRIRARGWNRRVLTFDDFEEVCAEEGIIILDTRQDEISGEYEILDGQPLIKLHRDLTGFRRTLVAFHEYGHHCWHVPGHWNGRGLTEVEADFVGLAALIPCPLLFKYSPAEIADEYGYPLRTVIERVRLYHVFEKRRRHAQRTHRHNLV